MRYCKSYILATLALLAIITGCKKKPEVTPAPVYNYFPLHANNEWVYSIMDVYNGADTLHVKVIGQATLSNNKPCWQVSYMDLIGLYKDTNYMYLSGDTLLTYTDTNINSLSGKWIMAAIKNNKWTGIDTFDKYY